MDPLSILLPPEEKEILLSRGFRDLHDDLRRGWHVKSVLAVHRQVRMAKAFEDARPIHNEVFGQLTMVVDPVIYEEMRREHGEDCWRDPEFRRRFARMNPECRVRSKSQHTRVAVDGLRGDRRPEIGDRVPVRARALGRGATTRGIVAP